ncbi:MAG: TIR domain-containing protein, partial [Acidobacteria bacterium]|nr:TIR domain-containing protein [Acidobacteriota bacterium]
MLNKPTVFLCHAPQDQQAVRELAGFLECGANLEPLIDEGEIGPGENLISKVACGLQADIVLAVLSADSTPPRWPLEEWTAAFHVEPRRLGVQVASVLLGDCRFPPLLRRDRFFDLTTDRLGGFRAIKQWLLAQRPAPRELFFAPARFTRFVGQEHELETLRRRLGDVPGTAVVCSSSPGAGKTVLALEFTWRCRGDFDGVFWVNCGGLSPARVAGSLAAQLGLRLEGDTESNQRELCRFCAGRRCLIVFDDVRNDAAQPLIPGGSASVLITTERQDLPWPAVPLESLPGRPSPVGELAATGGDQLRLLAALCAGAPAGSSLTLAAQAAGIDVTTALDLVGDLESRGLVTLLDAERTSCRVPELVRRQLPETPSCRHAQLVSRDAQAELPELEQALHWSLSQTADPEAWSLAGALGRRAVSLTTRHGRLAEAEELLRALFQAAEQRQDQRLLA